MAWPWLLPQSADPVTVRVCHVQDHPYRVVSAPLELPKAKHGLLIAQWRLPRIGVRERALFIVLRAKFEHGLQLSSHDM